MTRSTRRIPFLVAGFLAVLALLAVGVYLYDHGRRDLIASGVKVDGVAVGGLHRDAARTRIQTTLLAALDQPVVIHSGNRSWSLTGRQANLAVDANALVDQALQASREGSILTRTMRGLTGGSVQRDIPLSVTFSHGSVRSLLLRVRTALNRQPENASVQPTASGLVSKRSRSGVVVDNRLLARQVERALTDAHASRELSVPLKRVRPAVTAQQLASRYPAYIVIDRSAYTLRFYDHLKLLKSYPIAVGMQGLETPPGLYDIQWKQVNPPWYVPNSAWAGSLAGKTIPPGPQDPLKARFMSFNGGAGIHGIDPSEYGTIGHNASHGCVRMTIPDVIDLYDRAPVGTPVYVA